MHATRNLAFFKSFLFQVPLHGVKASKFCNYIASIYLNIYLELKNHELSRKCVQYFRDANTIVICRMIAYSLTMHNNNSHSLLAKEFVSVILVDV